MISSSVLSIGSLDWLDSLKCIENGEAIRELLEAFGVPDRRIATKHDQHTHAHAQEIYISQIKNRFKSILKNKDAKEKGYFLIWEINLC